MEEFNTMQPRSGNIMVMVPRLNPGFRGFKEPFETARYGLRKKKKKVKALSRDHN